MLLDSNEIVTDGCCDVRECRSRGFPESGSLELPESSSLPLEECEAQAKAKRGARRFERTWVRRQMILVGFTRCPAEKRLTI